MVFNGIHHLPILPFIQASIVSTREMKLKGDEMSILFDGHPAPPENTTNGEQNQL